MPRVALRYIVETAGNILKGGSRSENIAAVPDVTDRLCGDHIDEVLDVDDRPNHVESDAEFRTDVGLSRAYMGRNESEARRHKARTQLIEQCGDDGLVIAYGPGTAFGLVAIEDSSKQVEHPHSPCTIANCVITMP